jgi:hypothetical protein
VIALHQINGVLDHGISREFEWLGNNSTFRSLHSVDSGALGIDRHCSVKDPNAALSRHRDGHSSVSDGIHRGRHDGHPKANSGQELGGKIYFGWKDFGVLGNQEYVVEA